MKKLTLLLALLALAAFGVAACGDDDDEGGDTGAATTEATTEETTTEAGSGGGGGTIEVSADPNGELAYEQDSLEAEAGANTIEFTNDSSTPHDVVIENGGEVARTDVIQGDTATADAELEAGEYTFYCSVPGHRDAGMEGPLTVE